MSNQTKVRANYMNKTAKLAFYNARKREGDTTRLAEETGFTTRFVNYVKRGERSVNETLANAMYNLARRRTKTNELTTA
jgi:hypothetical protein